MSTNDTTREQRRPKDVKPVPEKPDPADKESIAPTVPPAGTRDESERPIVDPVTGVSL
ncbi:hypothetical protein [Rhizobium azibense]|uniref:Uncharacterized protein n=1 Tax=Rhizobium azibense TaxID=1136135 RepID=A0A4R3RBZ7_9HYPH|nr:hypothetical protein [Rhizobium azibense]TCU31579.1 hypothetical protein EV129_12641 [Rhizobium azibense]